MTLLKIQYDTRYFVPEKKFRGRERGIKFLKKLKGMGRGIRSLKKVGMKGTFLL